VAQIVNRGWETEDRILSRRPGRLRIDAGSIRSPFFLAVSIFVLAAAVFSQAGFEGRLSRDEAVVLYSGQQMAQGVPHYISIFNHSGPLAPLMAGLGVSIALWLHTDDVFTVRVGSFIIGALTAVTLYFLTVFLFDSRQVGLLAAFVLLGFGCFGRHVASGPNAKIALVLFQSLSLLLTARRQWFSAGVCGSLAFFSWQPLAIYPFITLGLALLSPEQKSERVKNVRRAASGVMLPVIIVSSYFFFKGAFLEFVDGLVLFNLFHLERDPSSLVSHIGRPIDTIFRSYTEMAIPILVGLLMVGVMYAWRLKQQEGSVRRLMSQDRFAPLLLSFPAPVIWSLLDFQGCPDFFVFLPYAAIGFGWLLFLALCSLTTRGHIEPVMQKIWFLFLCGILIGSAAFSYWRTAETQLPEQRRWAQQIESRFGREAKLVSIGVPEVLVLLRRTNPNPYVFIVSGIDNRMAAKTPGGFDGWLEELEQYDPAVIALGPTQGRFKQRLTKWLHAHYQPTWVGEWELFVKQGTSNPER
jgi:hypothetical protein